MIEKGFQLFLNKDNFNSSLLFLHMNWLFISQINDDSIASIQSNKSSYNLQSKEF